MKTIIQSLAVATLLLFNLGGLTTTEAVIPPPDGGYPGGNTAEGQNALLNLTTGGFNTGLGFLALKSDTTSSFNTAVGAGTLFANTDGNNNTATGAGALFANGVGASNTATGAVALFRNTTGNNNTATGELALFNNTTGSSNIAIGQAALANNMSGNFNIAIGSGAGVNISSAFGCIAIGHQGADVNQSCFIGNIRGAVVAPDAVPVLIDSAGKLGTTNGSSRRFKTQIKPMDKASNSILALKPVTFHYKSDQQNAPQFGLIAEEVAEVNPDLVVRDENGEISTVRYDAVNAMLLNEFLKEHRTVQEQQATITELKSALAQQRKDFEAAMAQQQRRMEAFIARLNDHEAQIQKVSAEIEVRKSISKMLVED
jgi:uncharacterized coiled-coil protein SlyX